MQHSFLTSRRVFRSMVFGVALAMSPVLLSAAPAHAAAPAVAVTGLSRGARGEAVVVLQDALIGQGLNVAGGADGVFGPGTESALKSFQSSQGLQATGTVDESTALALGLVANDLFGLAQGARGEAVRKLQQRLVDLGESVSGGVDGIFGPGTAAAVRSFQTGQGFAPSGAVNAATTVALNSAPSVTDGGNSEPAEPAEPAPPSAQTSGLIGTKIGSRGASVVQVQTLLIRAGFRMVGGADGVFGSLTANALSSFQNSRDLPATAFVDEATAANLTEATADVNDDATVQPSSSPFVGLKYGSLGTDVKQLQSALSAAGIRVRGGADGVFGTATIAAVKEFQTLSGLSETGSVDEPTAKALSSDRPNGLVSASPLLGLQYGALGNAAKDLQQALIDAGVKVRGGADGIFGVATVNALKDFQTSQGLESTGVVDAETIAALANPAAPVSGGSSDLGLPVFGEQGARVLDLQAALVNAGINVNGGVDGDFGGGTSAAIMEFQRQEGFGVTGRVTNETAAALGLSPAPAPSAPDASGIALEVFPVQGSCFYGDSWQFARGGGRVHLGVDIIAPAGKLLYAVADGTITKVYTDHPGSLPGNGVRITMADGTYFFYAHMSAVADGINQGTKVKAGQVVGFVGNTGSSGTNHLHFEVHPKGGSAVNPYPLVKAIDGCSRTEPLPQV
jgi:peptidoglycan hydrolase-like protein with peptidoglycan-binding domain